jgi:hypothetical protein
MQAVQPEFKLSSACCDTNDAEHVRKSKSIIAGFQGSCQQRSSKRELIPASLRGRNGLAGANPKMGTLALWPSMQLRCVA